MRNRSLIHRAAAALFAGAVAMLSTSCGEVSRTGRAPAMLIIESLEGASGATPDEFSATVNSDVQTLVEQQVGGATVRVPTIYNDFARVSLRLALKNPGVPSSPLGPSTLNEITIYRYRVVYRRTDGRATQGVDVPYGFDGAFTVTVPATGSASAGFELVRHQAKEEPPLRNMANNGGAMIISTIAEITFYGRDLAGNEVTAMGTLSVNFGDWGDPK